MAKEVLDAMKKEMEKAIQSLQRDFVKVRTGRASTALVEHVHVDYYGSSVPINQVANLSTPDARTIQIAPWEGGIIGAVEKAILAANIGLTPQSDGKVIRINMPALTEDRRKEMVKTVKKMGEEAKVAIRNHRRDANEAVKAAKLPEDASKKAGTDIQKITDDKVAEVDKVVATKEKEIMTV
ncbi:MAG: ribosome recycling factor [Bdellovibrionales bacterium]|nr:ribosome recycling factor [Bdellovibrionales bacterium]